MTLQEGPRQATEIHMTALKELKASAAKIGETLHTTTVAWVLYQLIKSPLELTKAIWETPRSTGRRFFGLMRPKWSFAGSGCKSLIKTYPHRLSAVIAARAASTQH